MNALRRIGLAPLFTAFFFIAAALMSLPSFADAAVSSWQKGASVQSRGTGDFGSETMKESLRNLKATGADTVAFVIPYYQENIHATDVWRGWNTPDDAALEVGIDYAHSIGLKTVLKLHLESYDGQWRAHINPWNKDMWFSSYGNVLMHYARMASAHGAEGMVIGTELITLSTNSENDARWASLIGNIRSAYGGTLTYSANWGGDDFTEEVPDVRFWGALDYIGISAYYPLSWWGNNSVDAMKASWENWNMQKIKPVADRFGKPVLFTEIGYRSVNDSFTDPWNSWRGGWYDASAQSNAYTALFSYWNDHAFMQGGLLWDWSSDPNYGWEGNTDYTPQHKPAEAVIREWFGQSGTTPPPPPPPQGAISFTATGQASPSSVSVNQPVAIQATLTNGEAAASNVIVDLEVYSPAGAKVHQEFHEGQSFAAGQSRTYSTSYVPTAEGAYTATIGVFNSNWSASYFWGDAANFSAGAGTPPPPPQGPVSFTVTGNATPASVPPGASVSLSASVQNGANAASGVIIDMEVYDDANGKVFQQAFEHESFNANQTRNFSFPWTAGNEGSYTLKLGVFSAGWAANHTWNDSAATVTVESGTAPPPPPVAASIEVWWPTDGSHVSGVQPFKAVVPDRDISTYSMLWQVDGDLLNEMADSAEGYPHKESIVDLSGWNWKGAGPYSLAFTAKDAGGSTIATRSVNIFTE